jgi:hypothetical protein
MRARAVGAADAGLGEEARQVRQRPGVLRGVARDRARAAPDEELRDPELVEVWPDREGVLGADRVEDREHLVLLDEPARLLDRLRGSYASS